MISIELNKFNEQRLKRILKNYQGDYNSLFNDFFNYNIKELKRGVFNIEQDMKLLEEKYSMSSKKFFNRFNNKELDEHNEDFLMWYGAYKIWLKHKHDLEDINI